MTRRVLSVALLTAGLASLFAADAAAVPHPNFIRRIDLDGAVDPLLARYVERGLATAPGPVILRLDTPGGLDSSMRRIIKAIGSFRQPLACWVGPSGARAASAGAIILLGCPFATMSPGTNVGAAHPVGITGEVLADKVTNDAAAYARALAEEWDRDPDVAEQMVRASLSLSAEEARARGMIDEIVADERAVVVRLAASVGPGSTPVDVRARIDRFEMSFMEALLHRAVDPNLAFLLLVIGLLGVVSEILHPGITVGGVFGGLSLLGALVILGMLPVNLAGLILVLVGIGLMIAEIYLPGGVAGAAGLIALILGGLFLFDASVPNAQVSRGLLIGVALMTLAFFVFVVRAVMRTRRQEVTAATTQDLVGVEGVVERALDPVGIVRARNESWTARTAGPVLEPGVRVRVVAVDGLTLEVEPADVPTGAET